MENKFTITFGQQPINYIERNNSLEAVINDFTLDYPLSHAYIISGVRGSGKTVLLTNISKVIQKIDNWIVVDVNPNREILEQVSAGVYENIHVKHLFSLKSFSFSFHGLTFSIEGKEYVSNVKTILEKMLSVLKKHGKKLLITIDEASNNSYMRAFAHDFQSLLRDGFPVFSLMTGLFENVSSLQDTNNLTFLYRAPKIELSPLDLLLIHKSYALSFSDQTDEVITKLTNLTKGFAFAYQVVGYLFSKYGEVGKIYAELDRYLSIYVYEKTWSELPKNEKVYLKGFSKETMLSREVIENVKLDKKSCSVYRDRLIKRGLINGEERGKVSLVLPRFIEFMKKKDIK